MNVNVTNVLNTKSIEKQLKLYESRISVLQSEIDELQKLRDACQLLLGTTQPSAADASPEGASAQAPAGNAKVKAKTNLQAKIAELLRERHEGMTEEMIFDELRNSGAPLPDKNPDQTIQATLKKHPELFTQAESGHWIVVGAQEAM